jgi:hypothetical protein
MRYIALMFLVMLATGCRTTRCVRHEAKKPPVRKLEFQAKVNSKELNQPEFHGGGEFSATYSVTW